MLIKIALILSIVLQLLAAFMAIRLTKVAKYNVSWVLLTTALLLMALRRIVELIPIINSNLDDSFNLLNSWIGVLISVLILLAVFYIRKIFFMIKRAESTRLLMERKVLNAIIKTEENERKRFAKDLHDGLGPLLSSIKMLVSGIKREPGSNYNEKIIANLETVTNEAIISIKDISNSLSPHILSNFGLLSAINSFSEKINDANMLKVVVNSNINSKRFNFNTEVVLYRVVCELLTNTLKHASASLANIDIFLENNILKMYYFDNGKGFNVEKNMSKETKGMGLNNIITRLKAIDGKIEIISKPNQGVNINIQIQVRTNGKV